MPTPSLLIVPSRFKSGKLYSQIPTSGAGDFTVTRATAATRVNASGFIESVASGIHRLDYFASGGTVGCPALLVEPSGSNLALQSSDYSLTWISSQLNSTSGVTSPSGTNDATLFEATVNTARLRQTITLTSGTTYTFSLFGKFGSLSSGFTMNVFDENAITYGSGVCQAFNLNEGTLGASGTVGAGFTLQSVGMENYGNGWYRCRMTVLMGYTPTTPRVGMRVGTQITSGRPLSVVSGTVNVWGAQLETGSVATSYIPTTTGSVTRNAEVVSVTGAVSGSIGQTEGVLYIEVQSDLLDDDIIFINRVTGAGSNSVNIVKNSSNQVRGRITYNNTNITFNTSAAVTGMAKIAIAYKSGDSSMYVNGISAGTSATAFAFTGALNSITINKSAAVLFGVRPNSIRAVALYNTRLTNAQLAALTTP